MGLREGTAADMLDLLIADELDAAFSLLAGEIPEGVETLRVSEEQLVAAYPPGTAPDAERVSAGDLAASRWPPRARGRRSSRSPTTSSPARASSSTSRSKAAIPT